MLPKENPHQSYPGLRYVKNKLYVKNELLKEEDCVQIWTILDAVEYLITQGYAISVEFDNHYRSYWSLKIKHESNWLDCWFDEDSKRLACKSRIEAYTEGIRHCLNLMKDETNRS
jgi:hypothetical protein